MKIINIDEENLHIFWITSVKRSVKMWLMIILKVTKYQGFTVSLKDAFLKKPQAGGGVTLMVKKVIFEVFPFKNAFLKFISQKVDFQNCSLKKCLFRTALFRNLFSKLLPQKIQVLNSCCKKHIFKIAFLGNTF